MILAPFSLQMLPFNQYGLPQSSHLGVATIDEVALPGVDSGVNCSEPAPASAFETNRKILSNSNKSKIDKLGKRCPNMVDFPKKGRFREMTFSKNLIKRMISSSSKFKVTNFDLRITCIASDWRALLTLGKQPAFTEDASNCWFYSLSKVFSPKQKALWSEIRELRTDLTVFWLNSRKVITREAFS